MKTLDVSGRLAAAGGACLLLSLAAWTPLAIAQDQPQESQASESPRRDDWLVGGFDTTTQWITAGLALGLGAYLGSADRLDVRDLGDTASARRLWPYK